MIALAKLGPFRDAFLLRGLGVWFFLRMGMAWGQVSNPNPLEEFVLLGFVGLGVLLDARRRKEDLVLGNLGIGSWSIVAWGIPLAALIEAWIP